MGHEIVRYAVAEQLDEELWLLTALELPPISCVGKDRERLERDLAALLKEQLERGGTGDLWFGNLGERPQTMEIVLELAAPDQQPAWRNGKRLPFQIVYWHHGRELTCIMVPAIELFAIVPADADLQASAAKHLLEAIRRLHLGKALDQLPWALVPPRVEIVEMSLNLKLTTPLQEKREQDEEKAVLVLPQVASDLTRERLPVHDEVTAMVQLLAESLSGEGAHSILLVGESGGGKSSLFYELVRRRRELRLGKWEFWESSGSRLVAGMTGYGMWQERCAKLVRETTGRELVVHLGNLLELMDAGKSVCNPQGIGSYLKPYLARGQLRVVVECTPEQLAVAEREDPYLVQLFEQLTVPRPQPVTVAAILRGVAARLRAAEEEPLSPEALAEIDRLHRRFAPYSAYPGRPVRFLRNLLADAPRRQQVTVIDVQRAFARETGLPLLFLDESQRLDLAETRRYITDRVIGQLPAVDEVVARLAMVKADLSRPRQPIASLLFIGPTGVGKTEMAKTIAAFLFGNPERLIRFDMSEYADWFAVDRLIGARSAEGLLTARVREQPFSVVLLDEFEKAHPRFFDLLLQIMGEGRLTDAAGRTADFCSSVIIMTSNLGATTYQRGTLGFPTGEDEGERAVSHFTGEVRRFLRPEIHNRIDSIVAFLPLDSAAIAQIARRELDLIRKRDGIWQRGVGLRVADEVTGQLALAGWDPRYGARPLKRTIERRLLAPLAQRLNLYADNAPLHVDVTQPAEKIEIAVSASNAEVSAAASVVGESIAERMLTLRRLTQRLEQHDVMIAIRNRIDELERLRQLARLRGESEPPRQASRLQQLQALDMRVGDLAGEVAALEDAVMLRAYRQQEPAEQDVKQLREAEAAVEEAVLRVYSAEAENADQVSLAILGQERHLVLQLARGYWGYARDRFRCEAYILRPLNEDERAAECRRPPETDLSTLPPEEPWLRPEPLTGPDPLAELPSRRLYGLLLHLRGPLAYAHFSTEAGRHQFVASSVRTSCLVDISTLEPEAYQPPPLLTPELKMESLPLRRVYDEARTDIFDKRLDKHYLLTGKRLEKLFETLLTDNLRHTSQTLLETA